MKELLNELGFEHLPMLSEFVDKYTNKMERYYEGGCRGIVYEETLKRITEYMFFITQPLTKGMFIPCDKEGEPLTSKNYECWEQYQQAKERVLFGGWSIKHNGSIVATDNKGQKVYFNNETIEDAINQGLRLYLK